MICNTRWFQFQLHHELFFVRVIGFCILATEVFDVTQSRFDRQCSKWSFSWRLCK